MPNWQPDWTDVQFDYQSAYEAISTCYGCMAFLESREQALAPARERATAEWRGRYRLEFDSEAAYLECIAQDVVDQLRHCIRGVHNEIAAAEALQRFRVAERIRWEDEARAEHAREEQTLSTGSVGAAGGAGGVGGSSGGGAIRLS